jgi:peptidoglycan L-alanyl-D-glutamate endopeptidase CwlK
MPISIDDLDTEFRAKLEIVLNECAGTGVDMMPYAAIRSPFDQGRLWRQSRSKAEVEEKIASLTARGAPFLAHCIEAVGPQFGGHVTDAVPGLSWHQWGEAVDCYWLHDGKAEWSIEVGGESNGYRVYAECATKAGLVAGGYWQSIKDWPHLQKRKASNPGSTGLSLVEIDEEMSGRFG